MSTTARSDVEKQIAHLLEEEKRAYKANGRLVGGLGTIGHLAAGPGGPVGAIPKLIAPQSMPNAVHSSTADTILRIHGALEPPEQAGLRSCLFSYLDSDGPYSTVAYMVVFVLHRLGHTKEALKRARAGLARAPQHAYSNALGVVSLVLSLEYDTVVDETLDGIEEAIQGDTEHDMHIRERIGSIRADRLQRKYASPPPEPQRRHIAASQALSIGAPAIPRSSTGSPERTLVLTYRFRRKLGSGSFGDVWLVDDLSDGGQAAVKLCRDGSPRFVDALRKEAICLARCDHPDIPKLRAFGRSGDGWFLAMEYIDGVPPKEWLDTRPTVAQRVSAVLSIARAMQHAHSREINHRDLKLENTLVRVGGGAAVLDFGVAKTSLPEEETAAPGLPANVRNSAPEYIEAVQEGRVFDYTAKQDVWMVGILLYEFLAGRHPFQIDGDVISTARQIRKAPHPRIDLGIHASLASLLDEMLEKV